MARARQQDATELESLQLQVQVLAEEIAELRAELEEARAQGFSDYDRQLVEANHQLVSKDLLAIASLVTACMGKVDGIMTVQNVLTSMISDMHREGRMTESFVDDWFGPPPKKQPPPVS